MILSKTLMVDNPRKMPMVPPILETMSVSVTLASLVITVFCGVPKKICTSENPLLSLLR